MSPKILTLLLLGLTQLCLFVNARKETELPRSNEDFITTNQPDIDSQCPCLKPKGSNKCLPYQTKNTAATLEEALTTFTDPKSSSPDTEKPFLISTCMDSACRSCNQAKLQSFQQTIAKQNKSSALLQDIQQLYNRYGLGLEALSRNLEKLRADCRVYELRSRTGVPFKLNLNGVSISADNNENNNSPNGTKSDRLIRVDSIILPTPSTHARRHRQTSTAPTPQYYNIDCRSRGDPVEDGSVWCGLCDTCWQWAVLSSDYFPSYVSLLNCGSTTKCLSGYGQCQVRTRGLTLLRNFGTSSSPNWKEYNFISPISCDCQVRQSSALSRFIKD